MYCIQYLCHRNGLLAQRFARAAIMMSIESTLSTARLFILLRKSNFKFISVNLRLIMSFSPHIQYKSYSTVLHSSVHCPALRC